MVSGLELLEQISNIKNLPDYAPVYSLRTLTTTVDLKGVTYEKPITQERRTYPGLNVDCIDSLSKETLLRSIAYMHGGSLQSQGILYLIRELLVRN